MPWKMNENILYAPLKIQRYLAIKSNFSIYVFRFCELLDHTNRDSPNNKQDHTSSPSTFESPVHGNTFWVTKITSRDTDSFYNEDLFIYGLPLNPNPTPKPNPGYSNPSHSVSTLSLASIHSSKNPKRLRNLRVIKHVIDDYIWYI